ncbi:glycine betaine ABC transporter substrate-binding protein [Goodfellowiella coeruleoviolacea]|uniref:Osmoprotectant transport system substrate-binding protein n=1 Tax=Goodfellowiella coeruleoviolacea TaxID=334858 RepID=A0AAE3GKB8_9PSEU|nr:glycine betaine ABC transporter substrate-binding protein [Goodfellowiella coeruleoviolacea]MCP2169050.1 osmoprotectant transport system substrate-binding protein [Goodfellowiella coeruleoviolacea]
MRRRRRLLRASALLLVAAASAVLAGCGLSSGAAVPLRVGPGSITPVRELDGVELTVGSKDFTENIVLGYIAELALEAAGADVQDLTNIQGSNSGRNALLGGQMDLYWEYTGTAWISYMGHTNPIPDPQQQFDAVAKADEANGIVWTALSPLNNTYAFAVNQDAAARYGLNSLSDMVRVVHEDPSAATFCLETEFANRNDGFPGMQQAYGFSVPPEAVKILGTGAVYPATVEGRTCTFGEVFTTDGRILALNLKVLDDDKKFFPQYNAAVVVRKQVLDRYPQISQVLDPIARRLNNDVMLRLNAEVDVNGRDPADVARDWLVQEGFVSMP